MRHFNRGVGAAVLVISLAATSVACTSDTAGDGSGVSAADVGGVQTATDTDGSGVEASRLLLDSAPVVVVSAPDTAAQARAASVAVGLRVPMVIAVPEGDEDLAEEISRLGAERVLRVGEVTFEPDDGRAGQQVADHTADTAGKNPHDGRRNGINPHLHRFGRAEHRISRKANRIEPVHRRWSPYPHRRDPHD